MTHTASIYTIKETNLSRGRENEPVDKEDVDHMPITEAEVINPTGVFQIQPGCQGGYADQHKGLRKM